MKTLKITINILLWILFIIATIKTYPDLIAMAFVILTLGGASVGMSYLLIRKKW